MKTFEKYINDRKSDFTQRQIDTDKVASGNTTELEDALMSYIDGQKLCPNIKMDTTISEYIDGYDGSLKCLLTGTYLVTPLSDDSDRIKGLPFLAGFSAPLSDIEKDIKPKDAVLSLYSTYDDRLILHGSDSYGLYLIKEVIIC